MMFVILIQNLKRLKEKKRKRKNVFSFELEIIIFFNTIDLTLSHQHINDNSALFNRQAWQALGDMSQTTEMVEFVKQLDAI